MSNQPVLLRSNDHFNPNSDPRFSFRNAQRVLLNGLNAELQSLSQYFPVSQKLVPGSNKVIPIGSHKVFFSESGDIPSSILDLKTKTLTKLELLNLNSLTDAAIVNGCFFYLLTAKSLCFTKGYSVTYLEEKPFFDGTYFPASRNFKSRNDEFYFLSKECRIRRIVVKKLLKNLKNYVSELVTEEAEIDVRSFDLNKKKLFYVTGKGNVYVHGTQKIVSVGKDLKSFYASYVHCTEDSVLVSLNGDLNLFSQNLGLLDNWKSQNSLYFHQIQSMRLARGLTAVFAINFDQVLQVLLIWRHKLSYVGTKNISTGWQFSCCLLMEKRTLSFVASVYRAKDTQDIRPFIQFKF